MSNYLMTAAEKVKMDNVSVTQAVDLDAIETNSNASKVVTDYITVAANVDLAQVGTNKTNADASKVKTDFTTVTAAVNLDKAAEFTSLLASAIDVSNATSSPAANVTLASDYTAFDLLLVIFEDANRGGSAIINPLDLVLPQVLSTMNSITTLLDTKVAFRLVRSDDTHLIAYYGVEITTTYSGPTIASAANADIDINKIYGIKF